MRIGIVGGTGQLGRGLAFRWARAGHDIILGSRTPQKAQDCADELKNQASLSVASGDNIAAATQGDVVVIAVPYSVHGETLNEIKGALAGKIVVDVVVPLRPPKVAVVQLPAEGSAAQIAQGIVPSARIVSAFHNIAASKLMGTESIECDTLVFSDDAEARATVMALAQDAGTRGIDGGALANSAAAEAMTSVLISINRRYKVGNAGLRITGIP